MEERLKLVKEIHELCEAYIEFVEGFGNECASTDRTIESIKEKASQIKGFSLDENDKDEESEDWFGVVRWCNEDLKNALENEDYEPSEENITKLREQCEHHWFADSMIEHGWDVIYTYIHVYCDK